MWLLFLFLLAAPGFASVIVNPTVVSSSTLPSGSTQYIQNRSTNQSSAVFNVSSGTVAGKFIVTVSSVVVNESGVPCNVNPGLVDICKNVDATNKPIFSVGTNLQGDQLVIFDQLMPVFRYGINPGGLFVGPTSVNNQYITSNQSTNQRINFWDNGIMEIQTASVGDGGSYIVVEPQNTEVARFTSTGGITISSSMTITGAAGLGVTYGVSVGSITINNGGSSGKAICWKTATTLGFCSSAVDASGACTCN